MGLYEWLRDKQTEMEQRQGVPFPMRRVLDSKVLARRMEDVKDWPGYSVDLLMMHRLITRGPRNTGEGMWLGSLKALYRKEYGELRAERQGQQELL